MAVGVRKDGRQGKAGTPRGGMRGATNTCSSVGGYLQREGGMTAFRHVEVVPHGFVNFQAEITVPFLSMPRIERNASGGLGAVGPQRGAGQRPASGNPPFPSRARAERRC